MDGVNNPIVPGFAPDPSICLIGDTFFLVNSSFHVFPGLPIYASKDLVSWKHIGNAINRPSQISLGRATTFLNRWDDGSVMVATGGLYAPTIRHRDGVTYIFCTNIVHGPTNTVGDEYAENFFLYTSDIWSGGWSDIIRYSFPGIDPSVLFDDDGKIYVQGCKVPGFAIYNFELDITTGQLLTEATLIWEGWDKRFTEGPHVYKKDGWYYLLCAEGGTFQHHMMSIARSRSIWGPYESYEHNPVWTAYKTGSPVQHTGHADLFQDQEGQWWAVMLGVREKAGRFVMGRETFLAAVDWSEGGWPSIKSVGLKVEGRQLSTGRRDVRIDAVDGLVEWVFLRDPILKNYEILEGRVIRMLSTRVPLTSPDETATFIGKRQRALEGSATVSLRLSLASQRREVTAGMAVYKDEHRFITLSYNFEADRVVLKALNVAKDFQDTRVSPQLICSDILLKIQYTEDSYQFLVKAASNDEWHSIGEYDSAVMSGFDFTGPIIGLFAVGEDTGVVEFEDFSIN